VTDKQNAPFHEVGFIDCLAELPRTAQPVGFWPHKLHTTAQHTDCA